MVPRKSGPGRRIEPFCRHGGARELSGRQNSHTKRGRLHHRGGAGRFPDEKTLGIRPCKRARSLGRCSLPTGCRNVAASKRRTSPHPPRPDGARSRKSAGRVECVIPVVARQAARPSRTTGEQTKSRRTRVPGEFPPKTPGGRAYRHPTGTPDRRNIWGELLRDEPGGAVPDAGAMGATLWQHNARDARIEEACSWP